MISGGMQTGMLWIYQPAVISNAAQFPVLLITIHRIGFDPLTGQNRKSL